MGCWCRRMMEFGDKNEMVSRFLTLCCRHYHSGSGSWSCWALVWLIGCLGKREWTTGLTLHSLVVDSIQRSGSGCLYCSIWPFWFRCSAGKECSAWFREVTLCSIVPAASHWGCPMLSTFALLETLAGSDPDHGSSALQTLHPGRFQYLVRYNHCHYTAAGPSNREFHLAWRQDHPPRMVGPAASPSSIGSSQSWLPGSTSSLGSQSFHSIHDYALWLGLRTDPR